MLSKLSDTSLNAYCYAFKTDRLNHESWRDVTVSKALRAVPDRLKEQSLILYIHDTMVEKKGEKFELRSRLFDHAAHNVSNYLNGHCMVSILLSFPVMYDLPPERTGKCGRPKKYGERLSPKNFVLVSPKTGDWMIGVCPVITNRKTDL